MLSIFAQCQTQVKYRASVGGKYAGFYELYLCNNTFEVNYAYDRFEHTGIEAVLQKRIAEIQNEFGYIRYEILDKWTIDDPTIALRPSAYNYMDTLRYKVQYFGLTTNIPQVIGNSSIFLYSTDEGETLGEKLLSDNFTVPRFLREGESITYKKGYYAPEDPALYLSLCKNNIRSNFAIIKNSTFTIEKDRILFTKGGMLECQLPDPRDKPKPYGQKESCKGELIKEMR